MRCTYNTRWALLTTWQPVGARREGAGGEREIDTGNRQQYINYYF